MRSIILAVGMMALSLGGVHATLVPGATTLPTPDTAPAFLLLADQGASGGFTTPLPFTVVAGDLVLLENASGGEAAANWGEVVRFQNVDGHGEATVYSLANWGGFVLDPNQTGNISFMPASTESPVTVYTLGASSSSSVKSSANLMPLAASVPSGSITYNIEGVSPIPEPSTCVAGVLLLLPFGLSFFRSLRKTGVA